MTSPEIRLSLRTGFPVLRLVSLFVLLCMVPLALLTYLTIHLAGQLAVGEVNARARTTSAVTAVLVRQQMEAVAELTASYASRPALIDAAADGNPAHYQDEAINAQLSELEAARPGISGVFLTDSSCRLTQVTPVSSAVIGVDFSYRDWCKGVTATSRPYVSEAYRTAILGHPLVVAAAVFVRSDRTVDLGRPLAILGVVYSLDAIRGFADQVARVQGIHLIITDQRGTMLTGRPQGAAPSAILSAAGDTRVHQALAGRSGVIRSTTASGDTLSAFTPVSTFGWSVVAEVPADQALAGVRRLRSTVLIVAGLLGVVLLAGIVVMARTLLLRRQAESDLAAQGAELEALNVELTAIARRDPLSGLGNRRALQEDLDQLEARVARYGHRYGMALLDIDHFKAYNDTYGHQAGDQALQLVAGQLENEARAGDALYRYGGEEFLCIFPEQSLASGIVAAQRMRSGVEQLVIQHAGSSTGVLTISAGLAILDPSDPRSAFEVLKEADTSLYRAKQLGRNRVEHVGIAQPA